MRKHNKLVTRWQNPDLAMFHYHFPGSLDWGTFQGNTSPFGQIDERWDFRGFDFRQQRFLSKCNFENVDFSFCDFTHCRFEECKLTNTVFEKAVFYSFSEHGCVFDHCKFFKSSFHHCYLGYDGSKYVDCVYEKCQFRRTSYMRAEFTKCQFHNNNLNGTEFGSSSLADCVFTGKVKNVWFRGGYIDPSDENKFGKAKPNPMTVSFEDAELLEMTYTMECDLSKAVLPQNGRYYKFEHWKERLEHVASIVSTWPESEERKKILFYVEVYSHHAVSQSWMILNLDEYIKLMGEDAAMKYIELLSSYKI